MERVAQINPWRGLRGLPRNVWVLAVATFINRLGTMAWPYLALYATRHLGWKTSDAGLLLTSYGASCFLAAPFTGRISDHVGPQRTMKVALFGAAVVLGLYPFATSFAALITLTIVWAIFAEGFRPASLALITDIVTPENRKAAFALNRLAINLGMSVGPAVGGFLLLVSYDFLFWIDGATSFVAACIIAFSSLATIQHRRGTDEENERTVSALRDPTLIYFLLASIPVWSVFFLHEGAMPLFLVQHLGMPESDFGLLFTVNTILIIFLEVPLNLRMADVPHRRALALGALLTGLGFGCTMFAKEFWSAAAAVVLWTFGEMVLLPTSATFVADIAPANRRGQYMGLYQMMGVLALSLSTWIGTWALERLGPVPLWGGALALGCISAIFFSRLAERKTEPS